MFVRPSYMLVAAMAVIAAPAFAQDAAETTTEEITSPLAAGADAAAAEAEKAGDAASEAVNNAAESTSDAAKDAAAAIEEAMPAEEQAPADGAAAESDAAPAEGEAAPAEAAEGETTAPEAGTAATPAEGETAPAAEDASSSDAATASDEPKPGQYYVKAEHTDWAIRCIKADNGIDPCELYQLLKDSEGNSVAEVTMIPLQNGEVAAGATIVAPLETDLIKGLSLAIDGGEARGYPFSFCAPVGCVSRMGFTASELSALKRGGGAEVTLLPFGGNPNKPVALKLSLSGFTVAFDELSKLADEARKASAAAQEEAPAEEEAAPAE